MNKVTPITSERGSSKKILINNQKYQSLEHSMLFGTNELSSRVDAIYSATDFLAKSLLLCKKDDMENVFSGHNGYQGLATLLETISCAAKEAEILCGEIEDIYQEESEMLSIELKNTQNALERLAKNKQ